LAPTSIEQSDFGFHGREKSSPSGKRLRFDAGLNKCLENVSGQKAIDENQRRRGESPETRAGGPSLKSRGLGGRIGWEPKREEKKSVTTPGRESPRCLAGKHRDAPESSHGPPWKTCKYLPFPVFLRLLRLRAALWM
jgi:hypothetical protein